MRLRFTFWLNLEKDEEYELAETIEYLKEQRSFAKTIRDGIRLIFDLRRGKTEVLHALFPWVLEQAQPPSRENILLERDLLAVATASRLEENAIQQQLERLETLILQQGATPIEYGSPIQQNTLPAPARISNSARYDDDIDLKITKTSAPAGSNFANFAQALSGVGSGNTGKVVQNSPPPARIPEKETGGGYKKMDVPQFALPDFDQDDFGLEIRSG